MKGTKKMDWNAARGFNQSSLSPKWAESDSSLSPEELSPSQVRIQLYTTVCQYFNLVLTFKTRERQCQFK